MVGQALATSVYVHFPWCLKKCPYCDFASAGIRRDEVPHTAYADAVIRELAGRDVQGRTLVSVFFGGGTPSLWSPAELGRVLEDRIRSGVHERALLERSPARADGARPGKNADFSYFRVARLE